MTVPGTDPQDDWAFGNYYMYKNGEWHTNISIPGGIHNYNMVEYHGMIFARLGVEAGQYPIACSKDGEETFTQIELCKKIMPQ